MFVMSGKGGGGQDGGECDGMMGVNVTMLPLCSTLLVSFLLTIFCLLLWLSEKVSVCIISLFKFQRRLLVQESMVLI